MPPETPSPTCYQCSEGETLRETAQTIGRMEGTLNAVLEQAKKTNGSITTLFERANSHRSRLDLHNGRIGKLETESTDKKSEAHDWRAFAKGVLKGVLLLLAATGIAYLTKAFN